MARNNYSFAKRQKELAKKKKKEEKRQRKIEKKLQKAQEGNTEETTPTLAQDEEPQQP